MSGQLTFFRKSYCDYERTYVTATASEGTGALSVLDRSNRTLWGTSGSVDANNTTLTIDMVDTVTIDTILLIKHNFKNFKIQYWDLVGLVWANFSLAINPTTSTDSTSYFTFTPVQTTKLVLTIYGTQVVDADKVLCQFIATAKIAQLNGWPVLKKPLLSRNLQERPMLSGKRHILQNIGFYSVSLSVKNWSDATDLTTVETLYSSSEGFLFWPCGSNQTQFRSVRQGYRLEDIYLVRCKNELTPEFVDGLYQAGLNLQIDLIEVIT